MNRYGQPHRKTTIWLGSDDGEEGMNGHGYEVSREDDMVSVEYTGRLGENDEELQVFILPDLFPAIGKVMKALREARRPPNDKREKGLLVFYAGPGGGTSPRPPDKYDDPVRLLGHEVTRHENGTIEILVRWEYA